MAKYRALQVNFWDDGFVLDLTPEEKYFYIYLLTNSRTSQCGCYELPYKIMEMQTGYNRETVEKLIKRFEDYGKIKYCADTKEILVINWHKFNFTKSPKVMNCILKEIELIKNNDFKYQLYIICKQYGYPIDSLSIDLGEKQKQKEKEKQKEKQKQQQLEKNTVSNDSSVDNVDKLVVVSNKIKSYFPNLTDNEVNNVIDNFVSSNKDITYLEEKLILTKNTDVRSVAGFLIKAIREDYKPNKSNVSGGSSVKTKYHNTFNEHYKNYTEQELEEKLLQVQNRKGAC